MIIDSQRILPFVLGLISAACLVAALFFLRFYRDSRDRLFLFFSLAFFILAINRSLFAFSANPAEADPILYLIRAFAYSLILIAIIDKNRKGR